jgi:hypothetical protein
MMPNTAVFLSSDASTSARQHPAVAEGTSQTLDDMQELASDWPCWELDLPFEQRLMQELASDWPCWESDIPLQQRP